VVLITPDSSLLQALAKLIPLTMALTFGKSVVNVTSDDLLFWRLQSGGIQDVEVFQMLVGSSELLVWENITSLPGVRKVEGRVARLLASRREKGGVTLVTALSDVHEEDSALIDAFWSEIESLHGRSVSSYLGSFKVISVSYKRKPVKIERWAI